MNSRSPSAGKAHHGVLHVFEQVPIGVDLRAVIDLEGGVEPVGGVGNDERGDGKGQAAGESETAADKTSGQSGKSDAPRPTMATIKTSSSQARRFMRSRSAAMRGWVQAARSRGRNRR